MMRIAPVLTVASCVLSLLACEQKGTSERAVNSRDLPRAGATAEGTGWQTGPFPTLEQCENGGSEWLKLDGKSKSEGLVIAHGLGRAPDVILTYIAFEKNGCGSTLGAGDAVVIDYADADSLKIHNNTDEYFYLRLVLQ